MKSIFLLICLTLSALAQRPRKLRAIGEVKGFQHDSVSHALATLEQWAIGPAKQ
jgi:hypothetical protein